MLLYSTILRSLRKITLIPSILKKTDKIKKKHLPEPFKGKKNPLRKFKKRYLITKNFNT